MLKLFISLNFLAPDLLFLTWSFPSKNLVMILDEVKHKKSPLESGFSVNSYQFEYKILQFLDFQISKLNFNCYCDNMTNSKFLLPRENWTDYSHFPPYPRWVWYYMLELNITFRVTVKGEIGCNGSVVLHCIFHSVSMICLATWN